MPNKLGEYIVPVYTFSDEQTAINNGYTELIRCKDCKWYGRDHDGGCLCENGGGLFDAKPNDFCSRGERKEE